MSPLAITIVQKPESRLAYITSIEIGDHVAILSSGSGNARIVVTSDGKKFHQRAAPKSRGLRGAKIIDGLLWITGEYGELATSADLAGTWTEVKTPTNECLWDIARDKKGGYWVCGSGATILRGSASKKFAAYKHGLKPRSDRADPKVETVAGGVLFPLFNALWNGKTLAKAKGLSGEMSALAVAATGTIVMVGDKGAAFRSTDGGVSWKPTKLGANGDFNDVAVVAGSFVAVGDKGAMLISDDDGVSWKKLASPTKLALWSIGSWGNGAYVGGEEGLILKLQAAGDTYWKGATDQFAPKPVVTATFDRAVAPKNRDERERELLAEVPRTKGVPRIAPDEHDAAILDAIDDVAGYQIYGDYLQSKGDVRGELVALATAKHKGEKAYWKKHAVELLDPELVAPSVELVHRWGFIEAARLYTPEAYDDEDGEIAQVEKRLEILLAHPAARFLKKLTFGILTNVDNDYGAIAKILQKAPIPSLRELFIGDFGSEETETSWSSIGDVSKLWPALPNLEKLTLHSGSMKLGKIVLPALKSLMIMTGGLTTENLKSVTTGVLPRLENLALYFGRPRYGADVALKDLKSLLSGDRFPRLKHLGLVNSEFTDELAGVLHTSPLVAQITSLDLSMGTLSDAGARKLATFAPGLAHLEQLALRTNFLSPAGIKLLKKALPGVVLDVGRQRFREDDPFAQRYAALGE